MSTFLGKQQFRNLILLLSIVTFLYSSSSAQQSVARLWNEVQLKSIRQDFARPPVQARNLFHVSAAMYDAWAVYDQTATTFVLGKTINSITYPFSGINPVLPLEADSFRKIAISYAAYRVLKKRYINAAQAATVNARIDSVFLSLGYDKDDTTTDYSTNNPVAVGNYIGKQVIQFGLDDGSREQFNHTNANFIASNPFMPVDSAGALNFNNVTRWQPLRIVNALDQSGNPIASNQYPLCPEWGRVTPFALEQSNCVHYFNDTFDYPVYFNPPAPPQLSLTDVNDSMSQLFKWGHEMVAIWSSHHTPDDTTLIDISPVAKGNNLVYPTNDFFNQKNFYDYMNGGDTSSGYTVNPFTGMPYTSQIVKRGDFARVVSQYWADGPVSETPPGHWYVILNEVSDVPGFVKKYEGIGNVLNDLEWDVKTYFALGGAMHDAAITAWGVKGWHDSPRPISAIRKMSQLGQCTDSLLPHYHAGGINLVPDYIELVMPGDPLEGTMSENLYKIKIKSWKGFSTIIDPANDYAGVDWILGENWMPYQRKTFVTPPFAGYISGHSTYSRAGAELMTKITGSEYFPGGLHQTTIAANNGFLVFEKGPSAPITLEWAKYRDASDEASLSRMWGGIHPPFDDINGRLIGEQIGINANTAAKFFFNNATLGVNILYFKSEENNCTINIKWSTTDEKDIDKYILFRSKDGIKYEDKLAIIPANANSNIKNYYTYTDNNPNEYNFYKLVEINMVGQEHTLATSYTSAKKCFNLGTIALNSIYPNPVDDRLKFSINTSEDNLPAKIIVIDIFGKTIVDKQVELFYGANLFNFNVENISSGMYILKIISKTGEVAAKKFEKL